MPQDDIAFQVADRRKRGYFTVDNVFVDLYGKQVGPYAIAVYVVLARFANNDSECWPGHAAIAERSGMSTRQVGREIVKLEQQGVISVTPRYDPETKTHSSNLYTLLDIIGIDTQSIPPIDTQSIGIDRKSNRRKLTKKGSAKVNKEGKSYIPDHMR